MSYEEWYQVEKLVTPAAGGNVIHKIPGETWELPGLVYVEFTTSAVVANRIVYLAYRDGDGATYAEFGFPITQAASLTNRYTWTKNYGGCSQTGGFTYTNGLGDVILPPGHQIVITADNIDVGDQFKLGQIYLSRVPSGLWADSPGATPVRNPLTVTIG